MPTTPRCGARAWRASSGRIPRFADRLEKEAADLKRRFNRDFWVEKGEYFALALDTEGNQVDALTSNNGHLLWSGIVDKSKAKAVADHLLGPRLFSGWGVRTLAEGEGRYNPIGYHVGTVWPFDNSFIAWGLRRYGFKEEAAAIAAGILDAAEFFEGACPEAFGGYERQHDEVPGPVPDGVQPPGMVDRHAAAAAADDARPRAASATISSSTRRCRGRSAISSCSTSRAAGGIDAFGRGRVEVEAKAAEEVRVARSETAARSPRNRKPADVFVVFGITGDLAKVMTFRSLYRLEARGLLDCPIVGVAVDDWTIDQLVERARESIVGTGEPLDEEIFERLAARLSYVQGDFGDAATYERVGAAIKGAEDTGLLPRDPAFLFGMVVKGLAEAGLTKTARVVVEKPFGHDLDSARRARR